MWVTMSIRKTGTAAFIKRERTLKLLDREADGVKRRSRGIENRHRRVLGPNFDGVISDECRLCPQSIAATG